MLVLKVADVCSECIDKERLWSVYIGGWESFQKIVGWELCSSSVAKW